MRRRASAAKGAADLADAFRDLGVPGTDEDRLELARDALRAAGRAEDRGDVAAALRTVRDVVSALAERKPSLIHRLTKQTFRFWERLGIHVTPVHFYEPVPDTRTLSDHIWSVISEMPGIDLREQRQMELLERFRALRAEYERFPLSSTGDAHQYFVDNDMFESVDGEVLYCMIRTQKPARIIEIGSGFSTLLAAQAIAQNRSDDPAYACELTAIEAHPNQNLRSGFPGLSRLIDVEVQRVPLEEFAALGARDILFIDSSHVLRTGGDVRYEYLEILPRLAPGVLVHAHDIFLPAEYPKAWVLDQLRFYTEQYLLQAFLCFNDSFEVLWASSFMHLNHAGRLEDAFPTYSRDRRWPGSIWLRKTR